MPSSRCFPISPVRDGFALLWVSFPIHFPIVHVRTVRDHFHGDLQCKHEERGDPELATEETATGGVICGHGLLLAVRHRNEIKPWKIPLSDRSVQSLS